MVSFMCIVTCLLNFCATASDLFVRSSPFALSWPKKPEPIFMSIYSLFFSEKNGYFWIISLLVMVWFSYNSMQLLCIHVWVIITFSCKKNIYIYKFLYPWCKLYWNRTIFMLKNSKYLRLKYFYWKCFDHNSCCIILTSFNFILNFALAVHWVLTLVISTQIYVYNNNCSTRSAL